MAQRLARLRQVMARYKIGAYLLPRTDEHQSQYLVDRDQKVQFLSGFTGSNAITMVSQNEALLWTDGRYLLQAQKQLFPGWKLMKSMQGEKKWFEYMAQIYPKETRIGFNPKLITAKNGIDRIKFFKEKGLVFESVDQDLIETIWENRPAETKPNIYSHEEWAGRSLGEKVKWVRQAIGSKKGSAAIFNDLSEIAWILNLRSSQIPHNPFFKSVLIITLEGGSLYLPTNHPSLGDKAIQDHLGRQKIVLDSGEPVFPQNSLITMQQLNYSIYSSIQDKNPIEWEGIGLYRAVRNNKQIQGFRRCHVVDGLAMVKFWSWRSRLQQVDEFEAAMHMDRLRSQQQFNKGLSFDTISGGGANGAIIHYRPTATNSCKVTNRMIHLVDSGGQYLDGTTDCTRAFHFGSPTLQEKDAYTRVLLGNLDLERLRWPANKLTGADIDVLARRHLWKKGKDYLHGTGHGVGHFGGVHEGPVGISRMNRTSFQAGMIVTNEPGYYEAGKYGIRIENMLLVREEAGYNYFQTLTLCPYDKNLIDLGLLNQEDKQHINAYHQRVWNVLSPKLKDDGQTLQWLAFATSPL